MRCVSCGETVKPGAIGSYRQETGWAKVRSKGGTNSLVMREETGAVMCSGCGERKKLHARYGIVEGQTSLV